MKWWEIGEKWIVGAHECSFESSVFKNLADVQVVGQGCFDCRKLPSEWRRCSAVVCRLRTWGDCSSAGSSAARSPL